MKKYKLFTALSVIGAGLALVSCGNTTGSTSSSANSTPKPTDVNPSTGTTATTTTGATSSSTKTDDIKSTTYVVDVIYEDGRSVPNVGVQWCSVSRGTCYKTVEADENGRAYSNEFSNVKDSFSVHLENLPEGYTYNRFELVESPTSRTGTIKIYKLASSTILEADANNTPTKLTLGYHQASLNKDDSIYIYFEIDEAGTYEIESYDADASGLFIYYYGNDAENPQRVNGKYDSDSGSYSNFKYSFEVNSEDATAKKTYVFRIVRNESFGTFTFSILKK